MILKAALVVALVATLIAGWFWRANLALSEVNESLLRRVTVFEAAMQQQREANAVLAAHLKRAETEAQALEDTLSATASMEGANAPLTAYQRAVFDRLLRP